MKQFTLRNLIRDDACKPGLEFVKSIIRSRQSVPRALKDAGHVDWISWALKKGYDLSEIRSKNFFWDDHGSITAISGDYGRASSGDRGKAIAGDYGKASSGDYGIAITGNCGTSRTGDHGTAITGINGISEAGFGGTAIAGKYSIIQIRYHNGKTRIATGYIGENGLKPNVPYRVDNDGNFYEVTDPVA